MSSSSSARRLKERGGAGGKITAIKPYKTPTQNAQKENPSSCKKPTGKENTRTLSSARIPTACPKPIVRPLPMQRIDKIAAGSDKEGDPRVRWSTSSLPKGKSSKPSDFARYLSDLRTYRLSRVSDSDHLKTLEKTSLAETDELKAKLEVLGHVDRGKSLNGIRNLAKCSQKKGYSNSNLEGRDENSVNDSKGNIGNGVRVLDDGKIRVYLDSNRGKSVENASKGFRVVERCKEKVCLNYNLDEKCEEFMDVVEDRNDGTRSDLNLEVVGEKDFTSDTYEEKTCVGLNSNGKSEIASSSAEGFENFKEKTNLVSDLKGNGDNKAIDAVHVDSNLLREGEKSLNGFRVLKDPKDQKDGEEHKVARPVDKYPSKLHEKLAFLEGKVRRIASDIKRTKEMLDQNNPDTSKLILSDIQDKISGIEKAVDHVMYNSKSNVGFTEIIKNDGSQYRNADKNQDGLDVSLKDSVKALNHEELEARFFPHHKLLRARTSSANSMGKDQNQSTSDSAPDDGLLRSIDENPIALEFLASLERKQSKINTNDRRLQLKSSTIQEMESDGSSTSAAQGVPKKLVGGGCNEEDVTLTTDENLEDFDDQENRPAMILLEDIEDSSINQLREIGCKSATGGWFVSEGESVLLAHDDGSCSFYDITNSEEKNEYKPPSGVSHNLWGDCWLIRATGSDGCSGRYVVAASAGNTLDSGFCSWDFYTKDIRAFRVEDGTPTSYSSSSRTVLGPLPNNSTCRRNALSTIIAPGSQQWWYKPCGPLLVSTASCQRVASIYDIRDGDLVMKWEVPMPVLTMDYSSPLQWRNKGKVVIAETEAISLWDVNSLNPQSLLSIALFGKKVSALHVNNTDAELGGGVRKRVSSSEAEGNDGVFCTQEAISVLDFRLPSGVGHKIPKHGGSSQSIFSAGDSIFVGSTNARSGPKEHPRSCVQHFSLRKGKLVSTYLLPESNAHFHHSSITQIWGNSDHVMGICGLGLFVFDTFKDAHMQSLSINHGITREATEIIGPDDLYCPSFDYLASRVLLISRDRPALWRYFS
ncbi:transducin/WD40 repeat-like superfamily protein [Tasmannia lanceolata]|uniref:transducin/WD40 repeat-like superfamily protein n=1 Tax=Tasmannia lanceolata TaxID=3420 RepID=UPI004062D569